MSARTRVTIARTTTGWWMTYDGAEVRAYRGSAALLEAAHALRWRLQTWHHPDLRRLLIHCLRNGGDVEIAVRGSGVATPRVSSLKSGDWQAGDASALVPEGTPGLAGTEGHGWTCNADAGDYAVRAHGVGERWRELIRDVAGVTARNSLGATAAGACPSGWHSASRKFAQGEEWRMVRASYYGGRVECMRPGWRGEAVEYDLRSAYGAALAGCYGKIPDHKIYPDRAPLPDQPAWYDCDVELSGPVGPLPVRDLLAPWRLSYPYGETVRGIWALEDLQRSGVKVKTIHRVIAGRWGSELVPAVSRWLDVRARSTDPLERALMRGLCNALAGKLAQRPVRWELWQGVDGCEPPGGALPLAPDFGAWAIPVTPSVWPLQLPMAASYITARVRTVIWPSLLREDAIYSDTDSIHLPADAPPPPNVGPNPGQWAAKRTGAGYYVGRRRYRLAGHRVGSTS